MNDPLDVTTSNCKIPFTHIDFLSCVRVLKIHTGHGSITAVLHATFQNDCATDKDVMGERDFVRFEFKGAMGFRFS